MIIDRQNENDRLERMRNIYLQVYLLLIQKVALNKLKNVLQIAKIAMSRFTRWWKSHDITINKEKVMSVYLSAPLNAGCGRKNRTKYKRV